MNNTFQEKQLLHLNLYYQNLKKLKNLNLMNRTILISLVIFFVIFSKSWAEESSSYILGNGNVIYNYKEQFNARTVITYHIVYYKKQVFRCVTSYSSIECTFLKDNPVDRREVEQ